MWRAVHEGIVLYEPFGGLCAGLEAMLRNHVKIHRYLYSDTSPAAQKVARHRVQQLHNKYPHLLSQAAIEDAFNTLDMNVHNVSSASLHSAGACNGQQWMVIAGPECKDFSPAGSNRGMEGKHSDTMRACIRIIGTLQQLQRATPPLYIVENYAMQHNFASAYIRGEVFPLVCSMLGTPVTIDAVRFGSYAHRLRNFWQNLAPASSLADIIEQIHRPHRLPVDTILDKGRMSAHVAHHDKYPFYPANVKGRPRVALPTLVAYKNSKAFRHADSPGAIYDTYEGRFTEPNPDERERALGYATGATAAPGVTLAERHEVTGNCIDQAALSNLIHLSMCHIEGGAPPYQQVHSLQTCDAHSNSEHEHAPQLPPDTLGSYVAAYAAVIPAIHTAMAPPEHAPEPSSDEHHPQLVYAGNKRMCRQAQEHDRDIHYDAHTLEYLRSGMLPKGLTPAQIKRVTSRARRYTIEPGPTPVVRRIMPNGTRRIVLAPADRIAAIENAHVASGHFGIRRTMHIMLATYWWQGIWGDVTKAVNSCKVCDRVKATFNAVHTELHPLPIMGLFYRWGVDLCGPFPETEFKNKYIMVMVEHFSKTMVLEPLPTKEAKHTAFAFERGVLARFGACAEVITDQGREFEGEFAAVLAKHFIDHRTTSANHPQADGLAERCVQTVKRSLKKFCEAAGKANTWDRYLPYIAMGYNCSKQASTNASPHQILYAREPQFTTHDVSKHMGIPISFTDPATQDKAAEELLARGGYLERVIPNIANNLAIAQHRDKLRYAQTRSGAYLPQVRKFTPGDFVYVRHPNLNSTLEIPATQLIARVLEVRDSGVVILQGKCGQTLSVHVSSIAPCHLPHLDGTLDPELAYIPLDFPCEVCGFPDEHHLMLLCDWCNKGYHTYCLEPKLQSVPVGQWLCPTCIQAGITPQHAAETRVARALERAAAPAQPTRRVFVDAKTRANDTAAAAYHGRLVTKHVTSKGQVTTLWGTVKYLGPEHRPKYFEIKYDDSSKENLSMAALKRRQVMPEGSIRPSMVHAVIHLQPYRCACHLCRSGPMFTSSMHADLHAGHEPCA